jgi:lipopolysaccharide transport system ATP-binding protein
VTPVVQSGHLLDAPIQPGMIYPSVYLPKPFLDIVVAGNPDPPPEKIIDGPWSQFALDRFQEHPEAWQGNRKTCAEVQQAHKKIIVIRDLRDTLISFYFSMKESHSIMDQKQAGVRQLLHKRTLEKGLQSLMKWLPRQVSPIQLSWLDEEEALHIRYEDLIADEQAAFARIIEYAALPVAPQRLEEIVHKHSFKTVTGRHRGTEDVTSHYRKGIAGDWRNYFTEQIKDTFKEHYGHVLIATGYESDLNW